MVRSWFRTQRRDSGCRVLSAIVWGCDLGQVRSARVDVDVRLDELDDVDPVLLSRRLELEVAQLRRLDDGSHRCAG